MKESTTTSDGRPLGTPHLNQMEIDFSRKRYTFMKDDISAFYEGKRVLDLGCGWGPGANAIVEMGAKEVVAIDLNEHAIEEANKNFANNKITYLCGDINKMDFDEKFDIIVAVEIVEHITDKEHEQLLARCRELLIDGGMMYISTPEMRGKKEDYPRGSHWTEYEYQEYIDLLKEANFEFIWGVRPDFTRDTAMAFIFQKVD